METLSAAPAEDLPDSELIHTWWIIPGSVLGGEFPCNAQGSGEKIDALIEAGFNTMVNLTTPEDNLTPYAFAAHRPFVMFYSPIPDGGVVEVGKYQEITQFIRFELASGRKVYVHCWGGIGRTATVAGCLLVDQGFTPEQALTIIETQRQGTSKADRPAPETDAQRELIVEYYKRYGANG